MTLGVREPARAFQPDLGTKARVCLCLSAGYRGQSASKLANSQRNS